MCYKELYRIHIPDKKAPLSAWVSVYVSIYRISKRINTLYNQKRRHFSAPFPGRCYPPSESPTSGIPAIEVNMLITPAITDADRTYFQSTCPRAAAVPIPAIAAWATVFTARIPAAFSHFRLSTDTLNTQICPVCVSDGRSYQHINFYCRYSCCFQPFSVIHRYFKHTIFQHCSSSFLSGVLSGKSRLLIREENQLSF